MIDLTLTINGIDFSAIIEKGSYITGKIPVVGAVYTDLNKVNHTTIARHRGYLEFRVNPLSPNQVYDLFTQLRSAPCTVKYFSFQDKTDVTQTMVPSFDDVQDAKKRNSGHWVRGFKISFTEE